jgi:16S rRNA (uracil1498-N3)-methyltransferase
MARRRFFVDEIKSGRAQIVGDHAHHLARVLRVEPGQRFEISDNMGLYLAEVESVRKDVVLFTIRDQMEPERPGVRITLLAALIRFERFEWLIEKATELGVEAITPIQAERSEKGLDRAAEKRVARWRKIAREASEQSRRTRLPEIGPALPSSAALSVEADYRLLLDEEEHGRHISSALPEARHHHDRVALLIGPEGGWTDRERSVLASGGWTPVGLGHTILRSETAAIAAIAIVGSAWQPL